MTLQNINPTYVETFKAVVGADDCDALGHMNVQHYFRAISEGMFLLMQRLGLSPNEIARRRLSFAVVRAETDFRRELRAGDALVLGSTIQAMGEKLVVFEHRLRTEPSGEVAMASTYKCVLLDLERRRAVPVPPDIRQSALAVFPKLGTLPTEASGAPNAGP